MLGEKVLRKEDPKFLTTGGVYIDDFSDPRLDGAIHVVFARSPIAHGAINSIDISDAEGMPGVIAVHTAASLGLEPQASTFNPGVTRTLLASGKVRWVGEPIAAILAETIARVALMAPDHPLVALQFGGRRTVARVEALLEPPLRPAARAATTGAGVVAVVASGAGVQLHHLAEFFAHVCPI